MVRNTAPLVAPSVTSITPEILRRGQSAQFTVTGAGFLGVRLTTDDPALRISAVNLAPTQISFTLTAELTAVLGPQPITLSNAAGTTTVGVTIAPQLPTLSASPTPLAVPPDLVTRQFNIRLSNTDTIDHSLTLASSAPSVASVSPLNLTITAGQLQASASITGNATGQAIVTISSATLGTLLVPVFVTGEFVGINTSYAPVVGVVLVPPPAPAPPLTVNPVASPAVGVVVGNVVTGLQPGAVTIDSSGSLAISGRGLTDAATVIAIPADGLTFGTPVPNQDGTSLTVSVQVEANAPTTMRQIVVRNAASQAFPPASPAADRLLVTLPTPEVTSVEPLFTVPGTLSQPLIVRGRNLGGATAIALVPATGIAVGGSPVISPDGTQLTVNLAVAAAAPLGPRVVSVTTPAGTSNTTASTFNTLTVVNELVATFTPIHAPVVGIVKEAEPQPPAPQTIALNASSVGVTLGSVVTGVSPAAGSIGDTLTLTITGNELQGVTAVQFSPGTGITAGAPSIAGDGRSLTVSVTLAVDAPRTIRAVQALASAAPLPAASSAARQFRVTTPQPTIDSVSPLFIQRGVAPAQLTIRGSNFDNAEAVRILPASDLSISPPSVNASATEITVNVAAAAAAALGTRVVVVQTPAGETSSTATLGNSVTITDTAGTTFTPIASPLIGVVLEAPNVPPPPVQVGPIASPIVGVVVAADPPPPVNTPVFLPSAVLGVTLGSVATQSEPAGAARGTSVDIVIQGVGLDAVTAVTLAPSTDITIGTLQVNAEGTQLTVPVSIAANAVAGSREIVLTAGGSRVAFASAASGRFYIATGTPRIDSITPIVAPQGAAVSLLIRGEHLQATSAVTATPGSGLIFGNSIVVNATGTEVTVPLFVQPGAPLGSHVIRVVTPAGASSATAAPANTFTVVVP